MHFVKQNLSLAEDRLTKTLSENFSIKLEEGRISPRMRLPIVTVLKGDAPYERGYHTEQSRLLPPPPPPVEEAQEVPAQANKDEQTRWQTKGIG
jgi:hypothetical protein